MSVERFQILSLDGGGIRGLYTARLLAELERTCNHGIADLFDLIVGTSTGGILAIGLGLGVPVNEMVDLYRREGRQIFPRGLVPGWRWLRNWLWVKYSPAHLESCLKRTFGEMRIGDSTKGLVVPFYDLGRCRPSMYKTPHHPTLMWDQELPAWQAAMGTTAAPTYLPASRHVHRSRHIDGGVWANNPAMVGVIEAHRFLGVPLNKIRLLSLGTTNAITGWSSWLDRGGKLLWASSAPEVIMRGQTDSATAMAMHLLGRDRVLRVNPNVPPSWAALDEMNSDEFESRAWAESRDAVPAFSELFLGHTGMNLEQLRALGAAKMESDKCDSKNSN